MGLVSEVSICSNALTYIGQDEIMSLTDDTSKRAKTCNRLYARTRNSLLQEHPWNFAIARASLGLIATPITSEFTNNFQLPLDFLQMLAISPKPTSEIDYRIEGKVILSDEATLSIKYVKEVTDPTIFSSTFVTALEYRLAMLMAIPLTGDSSRAAEMQSLYNDALGISKNLDSKEDPVETYQCDDILQARGG